MSAEVWSAVAAVASTVTAAVALVVALLNRRRDLARTEQLRQETLALDEAIRLRALPEAGGASGPLSGDA
ncbi:MAG TPA: hypothetical protein VFU35_09835 [Jatrophihabitans sp.]|nr:hypothetical protein [Jatrophihabitans sp.]